MNILLVPDTKPGHGTGHLRRCISLLDRLPGALLLLEDETGTHGVRSRYPAVLDCVAEERLVGAAPQNNDIVVLDLFHASESDVHRFEPATTVGLDIGGPGRELCTFVIDTLPRRDRSPANVSAPWFLELPVWQPVQEHASGRILVTFGGEDPVRLTEKTVQSLRELGIGSALITVVRPAGRQSLGGMAAGVTVVEPVASLSPLFKQHETVVCAFGLTAYEAAASGRRVITVAPSQYHDQLARQAGFSRAGCLAPRRAMLSAGLRTPLPADLPDQRKAGGYAGLASAIVDLAGRKRGCPAHPEAYGQVIWRNATRSAFVCPICGLVYVTDFVADHRTYEEDYFGAEYKAQYGRTYLEDFGNIQRMGEDRLAIVGRLVPDAKTVLDVGCAYGPFLQAARAAGFDAYGIDVSVEAVRYASEVLGFPAVAADVLQFDPAKAFGAATFDLVTLWYVIEHFVELDRLLGRLARWVRPGGVLAISTPTIEGISGRSNVNQFLDASPRDHFTVWHRRAAVRLLDQHGFRLRRVRSTGHHAERYPLVRRGIMPASLAAVHSRVFRLGDTFELYFERITHG